MSVTAEQFVADPLFVFAAFLVVIGEAGILFGFLNRMGGTFSRAIAPSGKLPTLEGLRGILALSVVIHHGCCWYYYSRVGIWETGKSIVFARLAAFGVIQFFYISGYLFWRKLMRQGRIPLGRFYVSRFIRIGPVYYVCVGSAILIGLFVTGFAFRTSSAQLVRSLASWLMFCLGGLPAVNGADTSRIISGVTWTLAMEWGFYLLLPFLGWFSRRVRRLPLLLLVLAIGWMTLKVACARATGVPHILAVLLEIKEVAKFMIAGFGGGILVAVFESRLKWIIRLSPKRASWLLLLFYVLYLFGPGMESAGQIFMFCGFVLVIVGTDLFGVLTSRGVRLLGIVSYPIYLVHGIVYYLATRMRGGIYPVPLGVYIPETLVCMVLVVVIAVVIHFTVERPTMLISERIARGPREHVPSAKPIAA